ncbi:MAG: hypothetical protein V4510_01855 [bacterium]
MGRATVAVAVLALFAAGCAVPAPTHLPGRTPPETPLEIPTVGVMEGAFAVMHRGGTLSFGLSAGAANLTLFAPDDHRVAGFRLDTIHARLDMQAAAGEYVMVAVPQRQVAIGFWVASAGETLPVLRKLPWVSGFAVLADDNSLPTEGMLPGAGPSVRQVNVTVEAPPVWAVALVAAGEYQDLEVELHTDAGALLEASSAGSPFGLLVPLPALQGHQEWSVPAKTYLGSASGHVVAGVVRYTALDGAILLTWTTYSRAGHLSAVATEPSPTGFSYGPLGPRPLLAHVSGDAAKLTLAAPDPMAGPGIVQVWDPDDHPLGPFRVPAGANVSLPVHRGGAYIFLVLNGTVELGADDAPADQSLYTLPVEAQQFPLRRSSVSGRFVEETQPMAVATGAVPFGLQASVISPSTAIGFCSDDVHLQVLQGNATIGSNGPGDWWQAAIFMDGQPLQIHSTGFGEDSCEQAGVDLLSFSRP